jgi:hypothetical protein
MVSQKQQLRHQGNWLSRETSLCSLQRACYLLSVDINCWKINWRESPSILSLDYKRPKSGPNSPVAPTWCDVIDVTSNRARQLRWMCGLCMKQRHSVTHVVQIEGQNWNLWSEISVSGVHISPCVWIHTVYCTQVKSIGMELRDEWWNILVGCLVVSQEGFQNGMQKSKLET